MEINVKNFAMIIFSVVLGVAGQISLKHGVGLASGGGTSEITHTVSAGTVIDLLRSAMSNPFVILGFLCYVISAASWLVILSRVELSYAYPLISIGYIMVMILSKYLFNETVTGFRIAGTLLICGGVFLVTRS
jgi:multidrug transporter EmrE-like cation transporter